MRSDWPPSLRLTTSSNHRTGFKLNEKLSFAPSRRRWQQEGLHFVNTWSRKYIKLYPKTVQGCTGCVRSLFAGPPAEASTRPETIGMDLKTFPRKAISKGRGVCEHLWLRCPRRALPRRSLRMTSPPMVLQPGGWVDRATECLRRYCAKRRKAMQSVSHGRFSESTRAEARARRCSSSVMIPLAKAKTAACNSMM